MRCFLISTLAEYQTAFWVEIGDELKRRGFPCQFISFDDRSTERLRARGFIVHALPDLPPAAEAPEAIVSRYGIDAPERWFLHERVVFNEQNPDRLMRKLANAMRLAEIAIRQCRKAYGEVALVQEVAGFLSVIGGFFVARKEGVPNWFIEPAFFKGRLFFTKDSFAAPSIGARGGKESLPDVQAYLKAALTEGRVVIPEKDRLHYLPAYKKILNSHNLIRLLQKSVDKYLLGKRQEFGYLGRQMSVHARMLVNSRRLKGHYTPLSEMGRFIYFPLHVPDDMAITLRSPEYVDQLALLKQILCAAPATHKVAVKEHPAKIGALNAGELLELRRRYAQFRLIDPATRNYDVLRQADLVVSINSKSGAEALLLKKRAAVLGDAFYSRCPLVHRIASVHDLTESIPSLLASNPAPSEKEVVDYFHAVWDSCFPGELYVTERDNIIRFCDSITLATGGSAARVDDVLGRAYA